MVVSGHSVRASPRPRSLMHDRIGAMAAVAHEPGRSTAGHRVAVDGPVVPIPSWPEWETAVVEVDDGKPEASEESRKPKSKAAEERVSEAAEERIPEAAEERIAKATKERIRVAAKTKSGPEAAKTQAVAEAAKTKVEAEPSERIAEAKPGRAKQTEPSIATVAAVTTIAAVARRLSQVRIAHAAIVRVIEITVVGTQGAVLGVAVIPARGVVIVARVAVIEGIRAAKGAVEQAIALG